MNLYLFDTNILLHYLRQDTRWNYIQDKFDISNQLDNTMSVVSWGEIYSLGLRNHWHTQRMKVIEQLDRHFIVADINVEEIIRTYGTIDSYSQGKLWHNPLPQGMSARNMGKNDLWIAATAHVLDVTLLTTDNDFDHLQDTFIKIDKVVFSKS
jgi:predicted nucleic acid-binding protein